MQATGWDAGRVRQALRVARKEDRSFLGGEILGSMCTLPHPAAREADRLFVDTNLGDPDHFPGTRRLEVEVLDDLRQLLHGPQRAAGRFLTGGTEANLFALYGARETTGRDRVVLPAHAHFSFEKAARLLRMRLEWVPSGPDLRADAQAMAAAVHDDTALLVGVAGSTELGLVDDIPALGRVARDAGVPLHVDAAFGGYVLPFLAAAGRAPRRFDFQVPGVWSVALDPHKMGLGTIPAGVLVLRDGRLWDHVAVETPYVSTDRQSQLLGTRPGAAVAASWAVHRALGRDGYAAVVRRCLENTDALADGLRARGVELVAEPELNVVTFRAGEPTAIHRRLVAEGFAPNIVPRHKALRIVVNPHVSARVVQRFLAALDGVLA